MASVVNDWKLFHSWDEYFQGVFCSWLESIPDRCSNFFFVVATDNLGLPEHASF
jgi:hypothetical protein